jgi:hypothetical protein
MKAKGERRKAKGQAKGVRVADHPSDFRLPTFDLERGEPE